MLKKISDIVFFVLLFFAPMHLQAQTVYTFSTCGKTGVYGPSQANINATYILGNSLYGQVTVTGNYGSYQSWTVPASSWYTFYVKGAMAGNNGFGTVVGNGAIMKADFYLTAGTVLKIIVGQRGSTESGNSSSGGGGSFVVYASNNTPIIIAGGGGGASSASTPSPGKNATTSTSGTTDGNNNGVGGTDGYGGSGSMNSTYGGGGGGGLIGLGGYCYCSTSGYPGHSFVDDGSRGGFSSNAYATSNGGGFGGGGGNQSSYSGGGGGGYSGGAGGEKYYGGGGGGSFLMSTATNIATSNGLYNGLASLNGNAITNLNSFNSAEGAVIITRLMSAGAISGAQSQCGGMPFSPNAFTVTETPSGGSGVYSYQWQSSTDNINFSDINLATNATYTPATINSYGKIYYRRKVTDDQATVAYSNAIAITVDEVPTTATASNINVCTSGTTATLTGNTATIGSGRWSFVTGPSTPTITNNSSPTSTVTNLNNNGTYNVRWTISSTNAVCSNSVTSTIIVGPPTIATTTSSSACAGNTINLSATPNAGNINWYNQATGGSMLGSGNSFTTPVLNTTTNYYAEAVGSSCVSASRTVVTATINTNPTISISGSTTNVDVVNLTVSGGSSYVWSGGNAINNASNAFDRSGNFTVQVIGANGCQSTESVNVQIQHWGVDKYGKHITNPSLQVNHFGKIAANYCLTPKGKIVVYQ